MAEYEMSQSIEATSGAGSFQEETMEFPLAPNSGMAVIIHSIDTQYPQGCLDADGDYVSHQLSFKSESDISDLADDDIIYMKEKEQIGAVAAGTQILDNVIRESFYPPKLLAKRKIYFGVKSNAAIKVICRVNYSIRKVSRDLKVEQALNQAWS